MNIPDEIIDAAIAAELDYARTRTDLGIWIATPRAAVRRLLETAAPLIAAEIARAIGQSVCAPGEQCAERWCPDCTRYRQAQADAATARRIGEHREVAA